ncbi:AbrB/MazE/SpoVT family DNA-binding domain-containing protein [uncultured Nevskia sp.]|uniref:AbrB/MazE/SpoVT family DNA-binding domain-containing protein n=1 Tax=uncultured Nevskia sp. TaxID=228950 RepID=UPI0025FFB404|nr:AbrB/MazE/SpoVT family DNA-binding domain-containing protein [uncultured Nevskia sp.]
MSITTLSSKGQLVLPKSLRDAKHWRPGTRLLAIETADGVLLKAEAPSRATPTSVDDLVGLLKHAGPAIPEADWPARLDASLRAERPKK